MILKNYKYKTEEFKIGQISDIQAWNEKKKKNIYMYLLGLMCLSFTIYVHYLIKLLAFTIEGLNQYETKPEIEILEKTRPHS